VHPGAVQSEYAGSRAGGRSSWVAAGEAASVVAFAALFARLALGSFDSLVRDPLAFGCGVAAGALVADLASGTVHWLCDRFGDESTPLVGPYLIASFREHHRDPGSIARHGFLERTGSNAFAAAAFLAVVSAVLPLLGGAALESAGTGLALAASLWTAFTNEIHLQAHRERPARLARTLQRTRLVLSPEAHARHHAGPHDRAYCIATGWANPALDQLRVFARLERRFGRSP
jgi:ubiquitin-conjugating enzyme E2 variant